MRTGDCAGRPLQLSAQQGVALLAVLALVAVMGVGLSVTGPAWQAQSQREKEREWLRVGTAYATAIARYRERSPGSSRQGPEDLQQLLLDTRYVGIQRHLRELYPDPLRPQQAWAVVRDRTQRVVGVRSLSEAQPFIRRAPPGVPLRMEGSGTRYVDWVFTVDTAVALAERSKG